MSRSEASKNRSAERARIWRENNTERSNAYFLQLHHEGKTWAARNPDKVAAKRRRRTLRVYGLTPELWEAKFAEQGRACAICHTVETTQWHTDHDHTTNKFRGILCKKCNNGIGQLQDNPELLRAAALYIEDKK